MLPVEATTCSVRLDEAASGPDVSPRLLMSACFETACSNKICGKMRNDDAEDECGRVGGCFGRCRLMCVEHL